MTPFKVGVCVILRHGTHVLMGLRKGSHGAGTWSFPGGHVDGNESPAESAFRELKEETGLYLTGKLQKLGFVLTEFSPEKRYITLYFGLDVPSLLEAKVMEPEKCGGWQWFDENQLPTPLFEAVENMLGQQHKLSQPSTWVPVTSRLPEPGNYLCEFYHARGPRTTAVCELGTDGIWRDEEGLSCGPTHWMPLPEEPNIPRRFEPIGPNAPNWRACPRCAMVGRPNCDTCGGEGLVADLPAGQNDIPGDEDFS